jgi:hypothetical protein
VEPFVTETAAPDWQIEQDEEFWYTPPADEPLVDPDGNPLETQPRDEFPVELEPVPDDAPRPEEPKSQERLDREWLERAIERPRPPRREPPPRRRDDDER